MSGRRLGIKFEPLAADSPAFQLDVEDAFLGGSDEDLRPAERSNQKDVPESEPE